MADELTGVKGILASRTNITGLLLALFGVLGMLGILPATLDAPTLVEAIVAGGGALVVLFRTLATKQVTVVAA